jgi:hypothetical protein
MSARTAPTLATSKAVRAGSITVYPKSSRRRRSSVLIAQISLSASRSLLKLPNQTGDALVRGVGNVISAGPPSGLTDDQIPLRTMSWPAGAVAVRPTASLVGLGQGTA